MSAFLGGAVVLAVMAVAVLWLPVLRLRQPAASVDPGAENVRIYRERVAELEAQQAAGDLAAEELARIRLELQRNLLADTDAGTATAAGGVPGRTLWLPLLLSVCLPVGAWWLYDALGAARDWQLTQRIAAVSASTDMTERLVALRDLSGDLEARLERRPADVEIRYLLARTLMELQRLPEAVQQYAALAEQRPDDATLLAEYAQARYVAANRVLGPETADILRRVVTLDPHNRMALGLLGLGAYNHGDYAAAERWWTQALKLTTDAAGQRALSEGINRARAQMGQPPLAAAADGPSLTVQVGLADAVRSALTGDEAVYVYARRSGGPAMPLAAVRLAVRDLPATVTLDDSRAMTPMAKLSDAQEVEVLARVSRSGQPVPQSGDYQSDVLTVTLETVSGPLDLKVHQQLP